MHQRKTWFIRLLISLIVILAGYIPLIMNTPLIAFSIFAAFLLLNIKPVFYRKKIINRRLKICCEGCELLYIFQISLIGSSILLIRNIFTVFQENKVLWISSFITVFLAEAIVFWNGIIRLYMTSTQIGIKWRIIGIVCGWIPIINLIVLNHMILLADSEVKFENQKLILYQNRAGENLCTTKYPILMVHGVFFRDFRYFNYWGRIPAELEKNGARIYYGNHQSAASVKDSAKELKTRIQEILKATGADKINIVAHSKGGLDCRYAICKLGMAPYVASLTTINTPHRGCEFADYLLNKLPCAVQKKVADSYQAALKKMGDSNPDFLAAVQDLTASACSQFNKEVLDCPEVYYQSVGSIMNVAAGGRFPLNMSYQMVKYFDGPNDGLVSEDSFPWGDTFQLLKVDGKRGISHGDMIDLNRENIPGFDVREFYVNLIHKLKIQGF